MDLNRNECVCVCVCLCHSDIYTADTRFGPGVGGGGRGRRIVPLWSKSRVKSSPSRLDPRSVLYSTNVTHKAQLLHVNSVIPLFSMNNKLLPLARTRRKYSWFQTFAVFWMLYAFFWVIPRRLNFICRRFGTLCLFHLHRQVGVKNELGLRNVGVFIRENEKKGNIQQ
jgi:hypothetical protein